ncbi:hypothetical protein E0765_11800 [Sulfuricurvum sp. IAE1]|uniref:HD domain-containing protein n=1 Tax=Sulfuricurvum sp. IAE1 TaxID=2546102 RepID=UPI0010430F51|nr:hypothetical protein [Sulfuricurvum sp. IAE1]TDA62487.1 hypothetical protein E0765_11800 [Sulfuricurvum sp. IAE1]
MWPITKIEKACETALETLGDAVSHSHKFLTNYQVVKDDFCKEIYPNIGKIEPNLSDHGEIHIQDVLLNAYSLLEDFFESDDQKYETYSPLELYVLCMAILVHDIGNIHGRAGHERRLTEVFNPTKFPHIDRSEMKVIIDIAKAHGGLGDTLSTLNHDQLYGHQIKSPNIASLVRFADELAEGPQRTSRYMIEKGLIAQDSIVYHQYASILKKPAIIQNNIVLEYDIVVNEYSEVELEALLKITYKRIEKLNFERIYCGQYSEHIQKLRKVIVKMAFYEEKESFDPIDIDTKLTELELSNLECQGFKSSDKDASIHEILTIIKHFCKGNKNNV